MQSTETFYEASRDAGFLKAVTWTPLNGAAPISKWMKFHAPTREMLGGDAFDSDYSASYPASWFPGLKRGEVLAVTSTPADARVDGNYRLRQDPREEKNGSEYSVRLERFR